MTLDLKACPFCGGKAERVDIEDGNNAGGSFIHCTVCDASGNVEFEFKENFVSNWNRRHTAPSGQAPLEGVKALEWEDKGDGLCRAVTPFSYSYFINARTSMWIGPEDEWLLADDPKAAAQADYEARIRSALLPASAEPVVDDEVLPCDVQLPGVKLNRGVKLSTLLFAIRRRKDWAEEDTKLPRPPASVAVEAGWQLVPKEPTPEMVSAAMGEIPEDGSEYDDIEDAWRAMLAAAPTEGR